MKWVISVGGSLIVPEDGRIDTEFIRQLAALVRERVNEGDSFVLVAGGGRTCRIYHDAAKRLSSNVPEEGLDKIGIMATRLNAMLLVESLSDIAHPDIILDPTQPMPETKVVVAGGWKPGWSTDYVSVILFGKSHADRLLNLSNIDYVYDKDPALSKDAKAIKELDWDELMEMIGPWKPGLHFPFDPKACEKAKELDLKLAIMSGKDIALVAGYLAGNPLKGTKVVPRKV